MCWSISRKQDYYLDVHTIFVYRRNIRISFRTHSVGNNNIKCHSHYVNVTPDTDTDTTDSDSDGQIQNRV